MNLKQLFLCTAAMVSGLALCAQPQRYCNPLPMPIGNGGNASGDVTVIEENGKYYMYCLSLIHI